MARTDATGFHSPATRTYRVGDYNGSTKVYPNTTVSFTGSRTVGAGLIVENRTDVFITTTDGGVISGSALDQRTFYPFGVKKVVISGGSGIVYVLHK